MAIGNAAIAARIEQENGQNPAIQGIPRPLFLSLHVAGVGRACDLGLQPHSQRGLFHASPPRPLLLWIHGVAFSAWIVFFIAQSALVRMRKVSVHRFLGWFGAGLAAAMVVLGVTIAVVMARFDTVVLQQKGADAFLSIPFADMFIFCSCIAMAIYWRKKPEYHRRLVFIASCQLMDAAFGRFEFIFNHSLFYLALDCVIVLGIVRDWVVDNRVRKVYLYALPTLIVVQSLAIYAWRINPRWWQGLTQAMLAMMALRCATNPFDVPRSESCVAL